MLSKMSRERVGHDRAVNAIIRPQLFANNLGAGSRSQLLYLHHLTLKGESRNVSDTTQPHHPPHYESIITTNNTEVNTLLWAILKIPTRVLTEQTGYDIVYATMSTIDAYRKEYRLRIAIPGKKSLEVTFPWAVVEREAGRRGMSVEEFIESYQVVALYDSFEGVLYRFETLPGKVEIPSKIMENGKTDEKPS